MFEVDVNKKNHDGGGVGGKKQDQPQVFLFD